MRTPERFRLKVLGFWVLGFRVWVSGFGFQGLGFRVLVFRVRGLRFEDVGIQGNTAATGWVLTGPPTTGGRGVQQRGS